MSSASGRWIVIVVANMQTKSGWVDITVSPEEKRTEDRLGHDVENAIKDSLRVWRNDVTTLAEAPRDGVEEPEEDGPNAADGVGLGDVGPKANGVLAGCDGDGPCNPEECEAPENEIAPL